MSAREILWPVGAAAIVLGVVAVILGQVLMPLEMNLVDAAGRAGTLLSPGGIATIGGVICVAGGFAVLVIAAALAGRQKRLAYRSLSSGLL